MHAFPLLSEKIIVLLQLLIYGKPFEHVKHFKCIGILFDENYLNMEMPCKYGNQ